MVAGSFWFLVAMRAAQAVFASALVPSVQTMLRDVVPAGDRGRAFGVQGSVLGVGAGLGPVIGGVATAAFGWRAIFGVNVPIVLAVLWILASRIPPAAPAPRGHAVVGASDGHWLNGVFVAAFAVQALSTLAQYSLLLVVPVVLDDRGWGAAAVGAALTCLTVGMVVTSPYGGRVGDVQGRRRPVVVGLLLTLVAVAASAAGGDDATSAVLVLTLLLFGIGLGAATPNLQTAGIEAVPAARTGAASGLLSASRYVGSITSTLVLAGVVDDDGSGLGTLLAVCVASLVAAVLAALALPGRRITLRASPRVEEAASPP
jgi:DHA2 family methylenomycin A resistance protein-like MFS transporter